MAGLTLFLLILLVILSVIALVGYISASIRLLYGFARGGAFTHANWWGKIDTKHNIPINVLYFSICANLVLGFLYLASPVGFQILLGSAQALFGKFAASHCIGSQRASLYNSSDQVGKMRLAETSITHFKKSILLMKNTSSLSSRISAYARAHCHYRQTILLCESRTTRRDGEAILFP